MGRIRPGQSLHDQLYVPVTTDDPLQTEAKLGVALALHGLVADLLRGLQEGVEDDEEGGELALELGAPGDQLLVQRQLDLNKMNESNLKFPIFILQIPIHWKHLNYFQVLGGNFSLKTFYSLHLPHHISENESLASRKNGNNLSK